MHLIRSELLKIRTTNVWWLFGLGVLGFTAIMLLFWVVVADQQLGEITNPPQGSQEPRGAIDLNGVLIEIASQIYTAGQYFALLFVMLLGALVITNEYFQQTATATFLTTPQRTKVILAKLATAVIAAGLFFVITTAISLAVGAIFFNSHGYPTQLGEWQVQRAILMNGLAFALWGVLGVGLGVLIRSQIGTVVTATIAYLIGTAAVGIIFGLIRNYVIKEDWVIRLQVLWPSSASQIMISPDRMFPEAPPWWTGALVLIGYGIVFGGVGTLITRRRDIS